MNSSLRGLEAHTPGLCCGRRIAKHCNTIRLLVGLAALAPGLAQGQLASNAVELSEDSVGPFGPSVTQGEFGRAQLAADFDGDGYDDLAVSRSKDSFEGDGGLVHVLRGGALGLTHWQTLAPPQIVGLVTLDFGASLTTCDLDGDALDDLMVGAPGAEIDGLGDAGAVFVYRGSESGLVLEQVLTQDDLSLSPGSDEGFGFALAAGDFDSNGTCDLAIGSPEEDEASGRGDTPDVGLVSIVYGLGNGSLSTSAVLSFQEPDVPTGQTSGLARAFDNFGYALAAVPGDGVDETRLLVGVPGKDDGGVDQAGRVWLIDFNDQALQASSFVEFADTGIATGSERFGEDVANSILESAAHHAVIGAPGAKVGGLAAGAVLVVPLDEFGQSTPSFARFDQSQSGFESAPFTNEKFGDVVLAVDLNRDGWDEIVISAPSDQTATVRGSGPILAGSIHVIVGGSGNDPHLNRFGEDVSLEYRDFGRSLAAGNFDGSGSSSLSVGGPSTDRPAGRGFSENDDHGALYLYRGTAPVLEVTLIDRTDGQPDGSTLVGFSDATASSGGSPAYRAQFLAPDLMDVESRVFVDGVQVFSDEGVECAEGGNVGDGFALDSASAFGYLDQTTASCASLPPFERGVVGPSGFIATASTVQPGGAVGTAEGLVSTSEGRLYFRGRDFLDTDRVIRTAPGAVGPITTVVSAGDSLGAGVFIKFIDGFDVSDSGGHLIHSGVTGNIADVGSVVLDGVRVLTWNSLIPQPPTARRGSVLRIFSFLGVAVDDGGRHLVSVTDDQGGNSWVTYGASGVLLSALGEQMSVGGRSLAGLRPQALSINDDVGLHLWGMETVSRGLSSSSPSGQLLLATCEGAIVESDVVLARGQALNIDGGPPAIVLGIHPPSSSAGMQSTDDRSVFLHVALERGSESFDAIIGVDVVCAAVFSDGFESGGVGSWSSATG